MLYVYRATPKLSDEPHHTPLVKLCIEQAFWSRLELLATVLLALQCNASNVDTVSAMPGAPCLETALLPCVVKKAVAVS